MLKQITRHSVEIAKRTKSTLYNVYFTVDKIPNELRTLKAPSAEDSKERLEVLTNCDRLVDKLSKDRSSRQACLSMNYLNHNFNKFTRCCSLYHAYILDNKIYLNVYSRSMNYNKNLEFDIVTSYLLLEKLEKSLNISKGNVMFIVNNLHSEK